MRAFLIGFGLAFAALYAIVIVGHLMSVDPATGLSRSGWIFLEPFSMKLATVLALQLVALPIFVAWGVGEFAVIARGTPWKLLEATSLPLGRVLRGFIVGSAAVALVGLGAIFGPSGLPDSLLIVVAAGFATGVTLMGARRARHGHCFRCRFDLRGHAGSSICPECGFDQFDVIAEKRPVKMPDSRPEPLDRRPTSTGIEATA